MQLDEQKALAWNFTRIVEVVNSVTVKKNFNEQLASRPLVDLNHKIGVHANRLEVVFWI